MAGLSSFRHNPVPQRHTSIHRFGFQRMSEWFSSLSTAAGRSNGDYQNSISPLSKRPTGGESRCHWQEGATALMVFIKSLTAFIWCITWSSSGKHWKINIHLIPNNPIMLRALWRLNHWQRPSPNLELSTVVQRFSRLPGIMSSSLQSVLESIKLNDYISGMVLIPLSVINLIGHCSCYHHCSHIWLL